MGHDLAEEFRPSSDFARRPNFFADPEEARALDHAHSQTPRFAFTFACTSLFLSAERTKTVSEVKPTRAMRAAKSENCALQSQGDANLISSVTSVLRMGAESAQGQK